MKKVKILKSLAGLAFSYGAGEMIELPSEQADKWVKAGLAVYIKSNRLEKAVNESFEKRKGR
ncbi:hypothetical protein PQV03_02165 [Thermoanaerobacterium thermosaccharolyticum]|uniref:hypothetical protein n=1 Tax=Thermoanaerobacterium thermosaccharolyticum TaxID=1517 RepID=UPI003D295A2E